MSLRQVQVQRLNTELGALKREVRTLRSLMISVVGRDEEGAYRPQFAREILNAAREKPSRSFRNARAFLAELEQV